MRDFKGVLMSMLILQLSALAFAQLFTISEQSESVVSVAEIQKGFTPWYFWLNFVRHDVCAWQDFRDHITVLNPKFARAFVVHNQKIYILLN